MSDIGDDRATNERIRDLTDLDAIEVLDLCKCRAHDVLGGYRTTPLTRRTVTSQHEKALRVTTHTSRHVIETVQTLENLRVLLISLKIRDQVQHAVVQLLVTTAEVNEHLRHVSAASSLIGRYLHSGALNRVESVYQSTDFIVGFLRNFTDGGRRIIGTNSTELSYRTRKALLGYCLCLADQTVQRTNDRAADHEDQYGEEEGGQHSEQGEQ